MGSSPGEDLQNPPQQPTPDGVISPGVGMQDYQPSFQSFLPKDPTQMATGLTSAMFAPQRPPAAPPAAAGGGAAAGAPPGGAGPGRDDLARMMAMTVLRDKTRDELQTRHNGDGWGRSGIDRYLDTNMPMPKAPMAGPAGAR